MTQLQTPNDLLREWSRLRRAFYELYQEYQWAYHLALQPTVADSAGTTEIGQSDPTGGVVTSKTKARILGKLRETSKTLRESTNVIEARRDELRGLMGQRGIPTIPRGGDKGSFLSPGQLEESKRKQHDREAAGLSWGEG